MRKAVSFDIFDTLLTRKVGSPTNLFLLVAERAIRGGLIRMSAASFRNQRVKAEEESRDSAPGREVTFDGIYRQLAENLALPASLCDALAQLELELEAELLVPVPGALARIADARGQLSKIIFISDMYLPASFIRDNLEKHGFWQEGDRLFLSNEWGASKADGMLYRKVMELEQLNPEELFHTGDRFDADFMVPAKLGIKARQLDLCSLTRYEEMLEEYSAESGGFSSLIAGASRLTRLQLSSATTHLETLSSIASSLVSPVITCYALWLLRESRQRGLRRLYFVARDGYLVKRICDALIQVFGLAIETRYLYGSRQAWHIPAITDFSSTSLSWLFENTRTLNLRIILGRLQLTPEHVAETLDHLGWRQPSWDQPIDKGTLDRLQSDLLASTDFRAHVEALVTEKREMAIHYLEQEGLFDPTSFAIVDLGWHGRLQLSLEKLLGMKQPTHTLGLYFGLYGDSPALSHLKTASYLDWDLRNPAREKDIPALVFLMESFCTAPHGSTIGYDHEMERVVPLFRERGFEALETWGISTVHAAVEMFAGELGKLSLPVAALDWDSRDALIRILGTFSRNPLPIEARAWGSFPYEDEQAGMVRERLTTGYDFNWKNIRIALTFGDQQFLPASWDVLWHGGQLHGLSASNSLLRLALKLGKAKRRIGNRLRASFNRVCTKQPETSATE